MVLTLLPLIFVHLVRLTTISTVISFSVKQNLSLSSLRSSSFFTKFSTTRIPQQSVRYRLRSNVWALESSAEEDDVLEHMRKALEESWNASTMGEVPTTPSAAAREAADSISAALNDLHQRNPYVPTVFLVDISLPSFDITNGPNIYDEVAAVDFCIELVKCLRANGCLENCNRNDTKGNWSDIPKAAILVKDSSMVRSVRRILDAREKDYSKESRMQVEATIKEEGDSKINRNQNEWNEQDQVELYDDFADVSSNNIFKPTGELLSSEASVGTQRQDLNQIMNENNKSTTTGYSGGLSQNIYRLGSMFGDVALRPGPDMTNEALKAVATYAMPPLESASESAIIILSPVSQSEMIGVRRLISDHGRSKMIVIVNCKLEPIPREILSAEVAYSVLPLIARPLTSEGSLFSGFATKNDRKKQSSIPKVVLLRRYPRDWELFVDTGDGFELVGSVSSVGLGKKGPSVDWIAAKVKAYLKYNGY